MKPVLDSTNKKQTQINDKSKSLQKFYFHCKKNETSKSNINIGLNKSKFFCPINITFGSFSNIINSKNKNNNTINNRSGDKTPLKSTKNHKKNISSPKEKNSNNNSLTNRRRKNNFPESSQVKISTIQKISGNDYINIMNKLKQKNKERILQYFFTHRHQKINTIKQLTNEDKKCFPFKKNNPLFHLDKK